MTNLAGRLSYGISMTNHLFLRSNFVDRSRVTCSPRDSRLASSNPADENGFFQDVKIMSRSPPESEISGPLRNLKSKEIGL